jgi:hypothetical protein
LEVSGFSQYFEDPFRSVNGQAPPPRACLVIPYQSRDAVSTAALHHERTSAVVPKNIPETLALRMLYPAFSHERQEDIGPFR